MLKTAHILIIATFVVSLCSCELIKSKKNTDEGAEAAQQIDHDIVTEGMSASSTSNQRITAKDGTNIDGSYAQFPPGSLSIDTSVTLEEGVELTENNFLPAELGISGDTTISGKGTAVAVLPESEATLSKPLTFSLPIPPVTNLAPTNEQLDYLVVIFRIKIFNLVFSGVIPRSLLLINDGSIYFQSDYFGVFQAVYTKVLITSKFEVKSSYRNFTARQQIANPEEVSENSGNDSNKKITLITPTAISLTASEFFTRSYFRGVGVADELGVTVSPSNLKYSCSFSGEAYSGCTPQNGVFPVHAYNSGGEFCVKSTSDDIQFSDPACVILPAFTAITCDEDVTENMSFEEFSALLGPNKTICFADGVSVVNEAASSFGAIIVDYAGMSFIARLGDSATVHNQRGNDTIGTISENSAFIASEGFRIVGLAIQTTGQFGTGIRCTNTVASDIEIIDNDITAGVGERSGTIFVQATGSGTYASGKIIGNRIVAGNGRYSRGIEVNNIEDFIVEDNLVETTCDMAHRHCFPLISFLEITGHVSISRNTFKFKGGGVGHGVYLPTTGTVAAFNDNVIAISNGASTVPAIYSKANFIEAKRNTVCSLGATPWGSLIALAGGNLGDFWSEPMQTMLSLNLACP